MVLPHFCRVGTRVLVDAAWADWGSGGGPAAGDDSAGVGAGLGLPRGREEPRIT